MLSPRIPETLSEDVLKLLHAPAKPDYPIISPNDLVNYDAFLFGIPTRYGNFPGQWKVCSTYLRSHLCLLLVPTLSFYVTLFYLSLHTTSLSHEDGVTT